MAFIGKGSLAVEGRLFRAVIIFIGRGGSAVGGKLFKTAGAELYCCWAGCGGLYELGCRGSLALVKGEGEASRACVGGACADGACIGGACADKACIGGACVGGACVGRACIDGAAC